MHGPRRGNFAISWVGRKSPVAEALERIAALYFIEKETRARSPNECREVRNLRRRHW